MRKIALVSILLSVFHITDAQPLTDTSLLTQELKEFHQKLNRATINSDSLLLEKLVSKSFLRVHGTNGGLEERSSWIKGLLKGSQNSQEVAETTFEKLIRYPTNTTAIEQAIIRRRTSKDGREVWLRRSSVYAKENSDWVLVQMQATLMYDGTTHLIKPDELNEYIGTYEIETADRKKIKITTLENQALYCPVPEGYSLLFFKTEEDQFLSQGGTYSILFERDNRKKIERFSYYRNNKSFIQANKVEQATRK